MAIFIKPLELPSFIFCSRELGNTVSGISKAFFFEMRLIERRRGIERLSRLPNLNTTRLFLVGYTVMSYKRKQLLN